MRDLLNFRIFVIVLALTSPLHAQERASVVPVTSGFTSDLRFSPDGALLAGHDDRSVRLYDRFSRRPLRTLLAAQPVNDIAFSPSGRAIAVATSVAIELFDVRDGRRFATLQQRETQSVDESIHVIAFSPKGDQLAVGTRTRVVLWDVSKSKVAWSIGTRIKSEERDDEVSAIRFADKGRSVVAVCSGGKIKQWNSENGAFQRVFEGDVDGVSRAAISQNGEFIAAKTYKDMLTVWSFETGRVIGTMESKFGFAVSDDGRVANALRGKFEIRDAATGRKLVETEGEFWPSAFSTDGAWLAAHDPSGLPALLDTQTGQRVDPPMQFAHGSSLASAAGGRIAAHTNRIWDLAVGRLVSKPCDGRAEGGFRVGSPGTELEFAL